MGLHAAGQSIHRLASYGRVSVTYTNGVCQVTVWPDKHGDYHHHVEGRFFSETIQEAENRFDGWLRRRGK